MKRILSIVILAVAVSNIATAQIITSKSITRSEAYRKKIELKRGYRGFAEIGGHFYIDQPEYKYGFDLSTTHGYQINRWLFLGAGIGLQSYKLKTSEWWGVKSKTKKTQLTLPLYADIRTYFTRTAVKPFAEMQIGYRIKCSKPVEINEQWLDSYYDNPIIYQNSRINGITGGLHLGIGVGAEYRRFSLKVMWYIAKEYYNYKYYENNIMVSDSPINRNNHFLSFTLGVNF